MKTVLVIGGGAAGISSALSAAENGCKVVLCESSPRLGGRLGSYFEAELGMEINYGEHLMTSGYVDTLELLKKIGAEDSFEIQKSLRIPFYSPGKKPIYFHVLSILPAPFNFIIAVLNFRLLSFSDRLKMVTGLIRLANTDISPGTSGAQWLEGRSEREYRYFWKPFIISALNCLPEDADMNIVRTALMKGFVRKGGLVFFRQPQSEIFSRGAYRALQSSGVEIHLNCPVIGIDTAEGSAQAAILKSGENLKADAFVLALPPHRLRKITGVDKICQHLPELDYSPIVSVLLAFKKRIFPDNFGCLVDSLPQWFFYKGSCRGKISGEIYELVISAADKTIPPGTDVIQTCLDDLRKCGAKFDQDDLLFDKIIRFTNATVKLTRATAGFRPSGGTLCSNVFLAGDWVDTGLPATIESAVVSGRFVSAKLGKFYT